MARIDVEADHLHVGPRIAVDAIAVDELQRLADDAFEKDVLAGGESRHQAPLLVDDADPPCEGLARIGDPGVLAVDAVRPFVRPVDTGDDLDEGALAGPVLAEERLHLATPERE